MDLKHEFETETGQGIGYLEGKEDPENNGTYNDAYVEWLENRVKNDVALGDVNGCLPDDEAITKYVCDEYGVKVEDFNDLFEVKYWGLIDCFKQFSEWLHSNNR